MQSKVFLTEADDPIDIRRDGIFKAVFTRDTPMARGALSKLVSALVGRELSIITIKTNEPPIRNVWDRQIRLDINCQAEGGELVNVEMSFYPKPFEPVRLEYYACKLFTDQEISGAKGYKDLKEAYQITILANKRFFPDEDFYHTFEYYDPIRQVSLKGKSRIITLELTKLDRIEDKPPGDMSNSERWAFYFEYLTNRSKRSKINEIVALEEGIAMASDALMTISRDQEERFRLMREEKTRLDWVSYMADERDEGHAEGLEKGRTEGLEEVARNALAKGLPLETIHEITGLDTETIKALG